MRAGKMGTNLKSKMAAPPGRKGSSKSNSPLIPGAPGRNELMKPLIFPNSQRGFKIFTAIATAGAAIYCVFIPDYPGEHIFMPIRRWVHKQKGKVLSLIPKDEEYIRRRTAELASEQTLNDTAKKTES